MSKFLIANWKMNGSIELLDNFINNFEFNDNIIMGLPYIFLGYANSRNKNIILSAQDCSIQNGYGSYTGDISSDLLKSIGVRYVIIAHSERRSLHNENGDIISKKIKNALSSGLKVIYCVSEEYDRQIQTEILDDDFDRDNIIVAYEPVSAIGTGVVPSIDNIKNVTSKIKEKYRMKVIYGGSVNSKNIKDIIGIDSIDGVLVGGASLKIDEMQEMSKYC